MEPYQIAKPSEEQQEIISCFKQGYNVKIEAVAGSGKTTTLLHLALTAKNNFVTKSLILTYNKDLQTEIKGKINDLDLQQWCKCYTYHGYASFLYQTTINNDKLLHEHLASKRVIKSNYQIILLDESQDLNPDYYNLVSRILAYGDILVLVGDRRQCINQHLNATADYFIYYEKYFTTGRPWKELSLKTSYRLTPANANFINKNILNQDLIIGGNISCENIKPTYNYSSWNLKKLLLKFVKQYGPEEVAILLPSTKSISDRSPLGKLMRSSNTGIAFCTKEDAELPAEVTKNKVIISNFHSFKGKEKACVFVLNFDESYFDYYCREWPKNSTELPNCIYVAVSRAKQHLILIQDETKANFRTTNLEIIGKTCEVVSKQKEIKVKNSAAKKYEVTKLLKNITTIDMIELLKLITIEVIRGEEEVLNYQTLIKFGVYFEDMRQYYGNVIPLIASYRLHGYSYLCNLELQNDNRKDIFDRFNFLSWKQNKTIKEWMELVVINSSINSKLYFYVDQITNYDWVDSDFIERAVERLLTILPEERGEFESEVFITKSLHDYNIHGIIDYLITDEIWEFKCTTALIDQHKIQCATYLSLYYLVNKKMLTGKLFNIRTNELLSIKIDNPILFIDILMRNKL